MLQFQIHGKLSIYQTCLERSASIVLVYNSPSQILTLSVVGGNMETQQ